MLMGRRILIIDDDPVAQELLTLWLTDAGYEVVTAADGAEGFVELDRRTPDVILCDRIMPIMSGFEFLDRPRRDYPALDRIPFVFLTALADQRDVDITRDLNPSAYLAKPIQRKTLFAALATLSLPVAAEP